MSPSRRIRVLFLIPSLVAHGAERQLCELVRNLDLGRFEPHVAVFYGPGEGNAGELWPELANAPGIGLHCLHKRRGPRGYLGALARLYHLVRELQPELLHGYMDGNLPVLLLGKFLRQRVVWGIRRTSQDRAKIGLRGRLLLGLMVQLSRHVDLVIFNSRAGRHNHAGMGMRAPRMEVVPNGFDVRRFRPDPEQGARQRQAWGIPAQAELVGIVGRLTPVKDHGTFLRAVARVARFRPEARFVVVGDDPEGRRGALQALAAELGVAERVLFPGPSADMPAVYNALSVLALTSTDEGFPNVLGEAMACGVPCVTTRVGDAEALVGPWGRVAEAGDDAAIAAAVAELLGAPEGDRLARAQAVRQHICSEFSTAALARNTEGLLLDLLGRPCA
jgi:glycosyltransferase involved in cell wall biosynthesis